MCDFSYDQAAIAQLWLGNQPVAVANEEVSHCFSELK